MADTDKTETIYYREVVSATSGRTRFEISFTKPETADVTALAWTPVQISKEEYDALKKQNPTGIIVDYLQTNAKASTLLWRDVFEKRLLSLYVATKKIVEQDVLKEELEEMLAILEGDKEITPNKAKEAIASFYKLCVAKIGTQKLASKKEAAKILAKQEADDLAEHAKRNILSIHTIDGSANEFTYLARGYQENADADSQSTTLASAHNSEKKLANYSRTVLGSLTQTFGGTLNIEIALKLCTAVTTEAEATEAEATEAEATEGAPTPTAAATATKTHESMRFGSITPVGGYRKGHFAGMYKRGEDKHTMSRAAHKNIERVRSQPNIKEKHHFHVWEIDTNRFLATFADPDRERRQFKDARFAVYANLQTSVSGAGFAMFSMAVTRRFLTPWRNIHDKMNDVAMAQLMLQQADFFNLSRDCEEIQNYLATRTTIQTLSSNYLTENALRTGVKAIEGQFHGHAKHLVTLGTSSTLTQEKFKAAFEDAHTDNPVQKQALLLLTFLMQNGRYKKSYANGLVQALVLIIGDKSKKMSASHGCKSANDRAAVVALMASALVRKTQTANQLLAFRNIEALFKRDGQLSKSGIKQIESQLKTLSSKLKELAKTELERGSATTELTMQDTGAAPKKTFFGTLFERTARKTAKYSAHKIAKTCEQRSEPKDRHQHTAR